MSIFAVYNVLVDYSKPLGQLVRKCSGFSADYDFPVPGRVVEKELFLLRYPGLSVERVLQQMDFDGYSPVGLRGLICLGESLADTDFGPVTALGGLVYEPSYGWMAPSMYSQWYLRMTLVKNMRIENRLWLAERIDDPIRVYAPEVVMTCAENDCYYHALGYDQYNVRTSATTLVEGSLVDVKVVGCAAEAYSEWVTLGRGWCTRFTKKK